MKADDRALSLFRAQLVDTNLIVRYSSNLGIGDGFAALLFATVLDPSADIDERERRSVRHFHGGNARVVSMPDDHHTQFGA